MFGDPEIQHKYSWEMQFGKGEEEPTLFPNE